MDDQGVTLTLEDLPFVTRTKQVVCRTAYRVHESPTTTYLLRSLNSHRKLEYQVLWSISRSLVYCVRSVTSPLFLLLLPSPRRGREKSPFKGLQRCTVKVYVANSNELYWSGSTFSFDPLRRR